MREPANDLRPPDDEDAAELQEMEIKEARVRHDALKYRGRPDLIEIAFVVTVELGRLNRELVAAHREKRPKDERLALLGRESRKAREFAAILEAMTEEERARFDEIDLASMAT